MSHLLVQLYPHGVNQQQYADDTQLFVFHSPSSLSISLCSLQRCVSSLHSWFIHNGLVLIPTKTEVICFGTNSRLQSLCHLTSIEVVGTSVSRVDYVKLLGVTFGKHLNLISIFQTSAVHPTSTSVLSAIFAVILTQKLPRPLPVLLLFPD